VDHVRLSSREDLAQKTCPRDEVRGLMANLPVSTGPATGGTRLSEWLAQNAHAVGAAYASELARHFGQASR
jgi:hypothetical protein